MFFNNENKKVNFVKAKTPEARRKQRMAIAKYYAKKQKNGANNQKNGNPTS